MKSRLKKVARDEYGEKLLKDRLMQLRDNIDMIYSECLGAKNDIQRMLGDESANLFESNVLNDLQDILNNDDGFSFDNVISQLLGDKDNILNDGGDDD